MNRKLVCLIAICLLASATRLVAMPGDSSAVPHHHAITIFIQSLSFEAGCGGTIWLSSEYSIVALVDIYHRQVQDGYSTTNNPNYVNDNAFKPYLSFRRHFGERANVAPYVGIIFQPAWYFGEARKWTHLTYGLSLGVESWITDNISVTGQHSFLKETYLNVPQDDNYGFGRSSIYASFYF